MISRIIELLQSDNAADQARGATMLGTEDVDADNLLTSLRAAFSDSLAPKRLQIIRALKEHAAPSRVCISALTAMLSDYDPDVRCHSAAALASFGERALPAFPDLVLRLLDDKDNVRLFAVKAIRKLRPAIVRKYGMAVVAIPSLTSIVDGEAAQAVIIRSMLNKLSLEEVHGLLDDTRVLVRRAAAMALGHFASNLPDVILRMTMHQDADVRAFGSRALATLVEDAWRTGSTNCDEQSYFSMSNWARFLGACINVLGNAASVAAGAMPEKKYLYTRLGLASALENLIGSWHAVDGVVQAFLNDDDPIVRRAAADILRVFQRQVSSAVLAELVKPGLRSQSADVVVSALNILSMSGLAAKSEMPLVGTLLHSDRQEIRYAAVELLDSLGKEAAGMNNHLINVLRDVDDEARALAAKAIGRIGVDEVSGRALVNSLQDSDDEVRFFAAEALVSSGREVELGLATLREIVDRARINLELLRRAKGMLVDNHDSDH